MPLGILAVGAGAAAMLARKKPGKHPLAGAVYYWCLAGLVLTGGALAAMRWREDARLLGLGVAALGAATMGRLARRRLWKQWLPVHVVGMGGSYILMLTAFYVDNGKNLPVWRDLPELSYWACARKRVGIPLMVWALWRRRGRPVDLP